MVFGLGLGLANFCIMCVMGIWAGQSVESLLFRGAIGFLVFCLLGFFLERLWTNLSKNAGQSKVISNTKPVIDFRMEAEVPGILTQEGSSSP